MRGISKKGQFFLMAAVILSAIILSFGFTVNEARTNREPNNFKDFSYEVKKETGAVLDYEIYSNIQSGGATGDDILEAFIFNLSEELAKKDPNSTYIFIYGNSTDWKVTNSGEDSIYFGDDEIIGRDSIRLSSSCLTGVTCVPSSLTASDFDEDAGTYNYQSDYCVKRDKEDCCYAYCRSEESATFEYGQDLTCLEACEDSTAIQFVSECVEYCLDIPEDRVLDSPDTVVEIGLEIGGKEVKFPFSSNKQVIFIVRKGEGDDNYVASN